MLTETYYLVVLRHAMDDLPILLTDSYKHAVTQAKRCGPKAGGRAKRLLSIDCTTPCAVYVYTFRCGHLTEAECVRTFD